MNNLTVQLNDLPDEVLLIILKNLSNVEVLYFLIGVNKRLNTIAKDQIFTDYLTLLQYFSDDSIYSCSDAILDRFCSEILPEIHHNIKWLNLEASSMKGIFLATNYPKLYGLGLYNIDEEIALSLYGRFFLARIFKNQISSLVIDPIKRKNDLSGNINTFVFTHIFTMFTNLKYLNFRPFLRCSQQLSFDILPSTVICSTLLELHVNVENFAYCLYLRDGRFNQLRALRVDTLFISSWSLKINNKGKLPNLRFFALHCRIPTGVYDELIVPFLHRMSYLEKLDLCLIVSGKKTFVDGNELKKNILNHMSRLNKFTLNIRSTINRPNQIISCVDYFQEEQYSQCHIYSYPYQLKFYKDITNNFPGRLFKYVTEVLLFDERPFEHKFFCRIQKSFPLLEELTIINKKPPDHKQRRKARNQHQTLSVINYPHLTELDLTNAHDDYIEQFLVDTKMNLPNNVSLYVNCESLKRKCLDKTIVTPFPKKVSILY